MDVPRHTRTDDSDNAQSPLRQLSEALGTANKGLQTLIETRDKKGEEEQELKGRAAFYTDHAGELAQAITEGTIPAHYSPFYVRGFKNAQGAAAGQNLRAKWQDAWDNWGGKDSEDPEAFNVFFQTFVKDSVGTEGYLLDWCPSHGRWGPYVNSRWVGALGVLLDGGWN